MKKLLGVFLVAVAALALAACGNKDFANDGIFTAYAVDGNTVTWVDVTIEKGKISKYFIDARQYKLSVVDVEKDGVVTPTAKLTWNEKTKKELKEDYNMIGSSEIGKEWFEQAEALEKYFLENGADKVTTNDGNYIDNVTGVSVKDGHYTELALKAIENAKNNTTSAITVDGTTFTSVTYTVDKKGKAVSFNIDALQGKLSVSKNDKGENVAAYKWNEKTKKELKEEYGMKDSSNIGKEWYEQAAELEKFFLNEGVDKVTTNDGNYIDNVTGVSVKDGHYTELAKAAIAKIK